MPDYGRNIDFRGLGCAPSFSSLTMLVPKSSQSWNGLLEPHSCSDQHSSGLVDCVERIWHIQDSQGQVLALAFRLKSLKLVKLLPLRSEADLVKCTRPCKNIVPPSSCPHWMLRKSDDTRGPSVQSNLRTTALQKCAAVRKRARI